MAIKKIRVKNFKSFKELEVELGNLNVLIGANASGKSNFVDIFRFLRDTEDSGLRNAISLHGGVEYLRNVNTDPLEASSLKVVSDQRFWLSVRARDDELIEIEIYETIYKIAIAQVDTGLGDFDPPIVKDTLTHKCNFLRFEEPEDGTDGAGKCLGSGEITISNVERKASIELSKPEGVSISEDDIFPPRWKELPPRFSLLESSMRFFFIAPRPSEKIFRDISIYDFDPKLLKERAPVTGKAELQGNGENLDIVLKNIIEKENERRKFFNLVTYLLPFVDDLDVRRSADKSLLKLRETYSEQFLPASLISDGTINMIALIIALYFEEKPLVIIEEPERNIHPHLISKVVRMMEDASHNKQIIVTTHNPEMVKHADPKDVLLVSRDEGGFSSISRLSEISDKERIRTFLENEIGVEELYVDNLLGI